MPDPDPSRAALVADVGGTNCRLALAEGGELAADSIRHYRNSEFDRFESVLEDYLATVNAGPVSCACVAVAGPVKNGSASLTNVDWRISESGVGAAAGTIRTAVINDMQALGHSLRGLSGKQMQNILPGKPPPPGATKLVVNVGTGFNSAAVLQTDSSEIVMPSESGHASLPASTDREFGLLKAIERRTGFASVEEALSGRGLETIHHWVSGDASARTSKPGGEISAEFGKDGNADEAGKVFAGLLGSVAGNLALVHLPYGGVYLAGSVAVSIAGFLGQFGFADAFLSKGRFSELMRQFPVLAVMDNNAPLLGCAARSERMPAG